MDRILMEKKVCQEQDMTSSLPDHILHEIMSLLPHRYAAITSVLSRRWLNVWLTFPQIQLDETKFLNREQFLHCLRATFARRRNLSDLQNLRLRMLRPGSLELYEIIKRFIDPVLLQGSALISLRVEGCRFESCQPVNLLSLKTLMLKNVIFTTQDFLQELLRGCPVLDNLTIKYCNGIKSLRVSHHTVQRFVLGFCNIMESLELDMPSVKSINFKALVHSDDELRQVLNFDRIRGRNLQTFHLQHFRMGSEVLHRIISAFPKIEELNMRYCEFLGSLNNIGFMNLTRMILDCVQVSGGLLINSSICPSLESLDLISCKNMKQLRIISSKLETLKVFECEDLEFCTIVSLRLSYFSYSGHVVRRHQIVGSRNLQVMLHLRGPQGDHDHGEMKLLKFTRFLHKFDVAAKAVTIRLTYHCAMCLLMMKDVHVPPLSYLLHLRIETSEQAIARLLDLVRCALAHSFCYNTLSMDVGLFSITLQFQEVDEEGICLRKINHACIEEHLVGVEMRNFQGRNEEVELVRFFVVNAKQMKNMTIWTTKEEDLPIEKCLSAFSWMHRLPSQLFQHFEIISDGSYVLFSKPGI